MQDILFQIWQIKPHTANKLSTYLKQIIDWDIAMQLIDVRENPTCLDGPLGVLMQAYKNNRKEPENFAAPDFKEVYF